MATGIRSEGIPMVDLFFHALSREVHPRCLDDTVAISAAMARSSPALRHLARTVRVNLGTLYELFVERASEYMLQYEKAETHKGDFFTKRLQPADFEAARQLASLWKMASK